MPGLDPVSFLSAAGVAGATELTVSSLANPTELNSIGVAVPDWRLCKTVSAGTDDATLYRLDASSASVNAPYVMASVTAGLLWVAVAGRYANQSITTAGAITGATAFIANGTITTQISTIDSSVTWNNAAITFTAFKMFITDTASNANSLLMEFRTTSLTDYIQYYKGIGLNLGSQTSATNTAQTAFGINLKSSGTVANNFGVTQEINLASDNASVRSAGQIKTTWATAADATRKARYTINVFDTSTRECLRAEASGAAPMLGFFGVTAVVQPATTGTSTGFTAGAGTAVKDDSTFTGGTGSTAYRISDIVLALKQIGALAP